ncbi:hypothetical protein [Streptomyces sp. NRRL WC-3742]|uniref:hypothetical protein n=1 Tax=Streptomyces sp. NRRL WC-3742 TaxID=1463934 RepID=UPI00131DEB56|nr:hypothetical protein [Streptomyces sp. NRRL WC-3742]
MAETTAVSGGPDPASDSGPWDAVPPPFAEEHPPGPAALYEPPPALPVPPTAPPTGWTLTGMPAAGPAPAPIPTATVTGGFGAAPRGRVLVVEGGYGVSGRRTWGGRGGAGHAPVLSAMLAAVSPQVLLAADGVDAVHLPGAVDPQTVLAHLRAAALHPGPLLVHLGGHVVADKRGGQLQLTLRDARQEGLPWQAIAAELSGRPADWQTLVIADLSADQNAWPYLQGTVSPLSEGIPLWAVVSPDPEQIGTFTRALIEALHGGRPGAGEVLAPEELRQQVYSVLRPDVVILATHAKDRPVFRNTARRADAPVADAVPAPVPAPVPFTPPPFPAPRQEEPRDAVVEPVPASAPAPVALPPRPRVVGEAVSLVKAHVPPTPPRPSRPVSLAKAGPVEDVRAPESVSLDKPVPADAIPEDAAPTAGVTLAKPGPEPEEQPELPEPAPEMEAELEVPEEPAPQDAVPADAVPEPSDAVPADETPADEVPSDEVPADETPAEEAPAPAAAEPREDYREVIGRIVRSADAGDHAAATDLAFALELEAIAEHGAVSEPVLQVRQVRAHVSRLAGRLGEAAIIYREVALTMLRSRGADSPETQQAATNAEACWRKITDRDEAVRIAPEIIELRAHLPGPDGRKLRAAERYLAQLVATPAAGK